MLELRRRLNRLAVELVAHDPGTPEDLGPCTGTRRWVPYTRSPMLRRNPIPLAAALLVLSTACGPGVADAYRNHLPTAPPSDRALTITGAGFAVQAAGNVAAATSDGAWTGALATLNRYLEAAVLTPLRSGGPAGDLTPILGAAAAARAIPPGADRATLTDEGLPPATGIRRDAAVATLAALAGPDGTISVVTARLDLRLRADVQGTPVTIVRTGDVILQPDGDRWKIDAYDLRVSRDSADAHTTTTATSP